MCGCLRLMTGERVGVGQDARRGDRYVEGLYRKQTQDRSEPHLKERFTESDSTTIYISKCPPITAADGFD